MVQKNLNSSSIRLNKYLALLGIASRRKADALITAGKIIINGVVTTKLGTKIRAGKDEIIVNGRKVNAKLKTPTYIILNKPKGVVSTAKDPFGYTTVLDLVKSPVRLYPVGRLDQDSHGLILLTNDGDLTLKLTHPKYHIPKVYRVTILGFVADAKISQLRSGVTLEDGRTAPTKVTIITHSPRQTVLEMTLWEGKKRQIRRMCAALHLHLTDLQRIAIGPLVLANELKLGKWRRLSTEEISSLKKLNPLKTMRR